MTISISDFIDVENRARELGCRIPTRWALLPRNFSDSVSIDGLVHESNAATVRSILRQADFLETPVEPEGKRFPQIQENDFTWVGPILFFAAAEISRNPEIVSIACGIIANYLTDYFKGRSGAHRVKLDVVVEQTKTKRTVRLHYDGPADGLKQLSNAVVEVCGDSRTTNTRSDESKHICDES